MEPGSRSYSDNLGRRFSRNHDGISNAACMDPHPPPQRLLSSSVIAHCAVWQVSLPLPRPLPLLWDRLLSRHRGEAAARRARV